MLTKTINGLFRVGLLLVSEILQWMSCRLVRQHEARNRPTAEKEGPRTESSCTFNSPAESLGYILSHPSYTSSVRVSVSASGDRRQLRVGDTAFPSPSRVGPGRAPRFLWGAPSTCGGLYARWRHKCALRCWPLPRQIYRHPNLDEATKL